MSTGTQPKCKLFKRHKWVWVKNIQEVRIGPRTGSMKLRGVYRCDCGETRIGQYRHVEEPTQGEGA